MHSAITSRTKTTGNAHVLYKLNPQMHYLNCYRDTLALIRTYWHSCVLSSKTKRLRFNILDSNTAKKAVSTLSTKIKSHLNFKHKKTFSSAIHHLNIVT